MTSFEPPSGEEDMAAQAAALEAEREALEAERAELMVQRRRRAANRELEQERAELAQMRAEIEAERNGQTPPPVLAAPADADEEPDLTDAAVYDIDPGTGSAYLDSTGKPVLKWPHDTVEVKGRQIQVRVPKASAAQVFGMISSRHATVTTQNDGTTLFVQKHVSPRSFVEVCDAMMDPDDEFDFADFSELVKKIVTLGTARPTKPSKP